MSWNQELTFLVTPKSGPIRPLRTLLEASHAIMQDLTLAERRRPHWAAAGWAIVAAADSGAADVVAHATESLVSALETEGWLTARRETTPDTRLDISLDACLAALATDLAACVVNGRPKQKPALRLIASAGRPGASAGRQPLLPHSAAGAVHPGSLRAIRSR